MMSKTTTRKQARRRARIDKRTDRDPPRDFERRFTEAIARLLSASTAPPQDVADALLDGRTLDAIPSAQRADTEAMLAEFEHLDHTLTTRGWQFCGTCSDPDELAWHYLPSRHEPTSELAFATTTIMVGNRTAATVSGCDVELVPAGCAWIDGCWSTSVATLLANLDRVERHRAGDDPGTLPF
jgi:hypothetical protein